MTLPVEEFLRRFLLHLLPPGFVRIRNFGFLANRRRAALLPLCSQLLNAAPESVLVPAPAASDPPGPYVRLLDLIPSYFHSWQGPSHACSTDKTRPKLQPTRDSTLQHIVALPRASPQQHSSPIASVAPAASFKSLY